MPEGPEVQTVIDTLKLNILNKKIKEVNLIYPNIITFEKDKLNELIDQEILDIERVGKFIIFKLTKNVLISHLRMEGKYYLYHNNENVLKHEHLIFKFDNNLELRYHDTRKFGRFYLRNYENYLNTKPLLKLGREAKDYDLDEFYQLINSKNVLIKPFLLNQENILSLGNIYVNEVLFLSKIHPTRNTKTISKDEAKNILDNTIKVLDKAIKLGGTTIHTFSASGVSGLFQNELLVHLRKGEKCVICGNEITKIKVGGRGTYVCEFCQK